MVAIRFNQSELEVGNEEKFDPITTASVSINLTINSCGWFQMEHFIYRIGESISKNETTKCTRTSLMDQQCWQHSIEFKPIPGATLPHQIQRSFILHSMCTYSAPGEDEDGEGKEEEEDDDDDEARREKW